MSWLTIMPVEQYGQSFNVYTDKIYQRKLTMNKLLWILGVGCFCLLAACATPQEKAARKAAEAARAQAEQQQLSLRLAAQCDPQAADLMRAQMADANFFSNADNHKQAEQYREKISSPVFQSCYKLAWDNYLNEVRLQQLRDWEMRQQLNDDMDWMRPRWCRGFYRGRPFTYQCR